MQCPSLPPDGQIGHYCILHRPPPCTEQRLYLECLIVAKHSSDSSHHRLRNLTAKRIKVSSLYGPEASPKSNKNMLLSIGSAIVIGGKIEQPTSACNTKISILRIEVVLVMTESMVDQRK